MLAGVAEDNSEARRGVSRRALFGLGLSRALDELPAVARPSRHRPPPQPPPVATAFDGQLAEVAAMLLDAAGVEPGMTVLDVCGGWVDLRAAGEARGASVVSSDDAPDALPLPTDAFDRVVSAFGVAFAAPPDAALPELFRVARQGGTVAIATWTGGGFMGAAIEAAAAAAFAPGTPDGTVWGRQEAMTELLEPYAGRAVDFERRFVGLDFPTPGAAWSAFASLPAPIAPAIEALDDQARESLELAVTALLPHQRMPGPVSLTAHLQLISARVP